MLIEVRRGVRLGVAEKCAAIAVPTPEPSPGTAFPSRRLILRGTPVFELNLWCGTCPAMFKKLSEPKAADLGLANQLLNAGLDHIDDRVLQVYGDVLPDSTYTALLLEVTPQLVTPGGPADYFCHEQIATWGVDPVSGWPEDPGTPYYRTFEAPIGPNRHLYELMVPMVWPTWNDRARVAEYSAVAGAATAVAYSLLDVLQPAIDDGEDYYEHWVLTHFLLDGHHKTEAAATAAWPLRVLSLVDEGKSIASPDEVATMVLGRRSLTPTPRAAKR